MNRTQMMTVALAALVMVCLSYVTVQGQAGRSGGPIAVVNLKDAFDNLREKVKVEADLQAAAQRLRTEQEEKEREVRAKQANVEITPAGSAARAEAQAQVEQAAIQAQAYLQFQANRLNRERVIQTERIYRELLVTIGEVAKERGHTMVMYLENDPDFGPNVKPEQLAALIQVRKVLWADDSLDITTQVTQRMNSKFQGGNR